MRRLYVGGLSNTVTEKDLKDRFGKFGAVEDVELRTRRDPEGVPFKTFGYVNITISDADLKKCLTVLNKSKWKGGTLQIEIAKESFLHRLAQERQEAAEQHLRQPAAEDKTQKLLDSLSKSGVDNFTMKAAVPGTEIPGHKDWVVSKFGRVLPILQLRKGNKSRTLKYDPSKYSHNIRKLDRNAATDEFTPITQLTWEVQGGDDDISKKRRGEFPPSEPWKPKKSRTDNASGRTRFEHPVSRVSYSEAHRLTNGFEKQNNHRPAQRRWTHFSESDVDSDEEIRRLVAAQQSSHVTPPQEEVEEADLEVVGYDFLAKSARKADQKDADDNDDYDSADTDELFASRKPRPPKCQEKHTPPTAEHFSGNNMDKKRRAKKNKAGEQEDEAGSTDDEEHLISRKPSSVQQKGNSEQKLNKKPAVKPPSSQSDSDEGDEGDENEVDSADSCSDSDYEAMFSNVTHLEISLADLQKLAGEAQQISKTTAPGILGAKLEQKRNLTISPAEQPAPKKGTTPEEILAAIMEDDSSEDEQKKKKRKRKAVMSAPLPAFQGTKAMGELLETDENEQEDGRGREVKKQRMNSDTAQLVHNATDSKTVMGQKPAEAKISDSSGQEEDDKEEEEDDSEEDESDDLEEQKGEDMAAPDVFKMVPDKVCVIPEKAEIETSSGNDDDDEEEEEEQERVNANHTAVKAKSAAKASPSSCSSSEDDENEQQINSETATSEDEEEEERAPPRVALGVEEEEELQRQANMRRLAAVQQRQKEAEEHKRLIQGALANLDAPAAGAGKHIVFGSDDDVDDGSDDDGDDKRRMVSTSKKTLFQDSQSEDEATGDEAAANGSAKAKENSSGPQLFRGSDDDDDDAEEEDGSRFDIKPQFEGQAGQKLMALQSRFGTDERFRMDSRFLEEDEEDKEEESRETVDAETKNTLVEDDEDLEEEKKKNLSILHSVLGQQQCSSKSAGKAKKFRDVSALHYDPSKEEHAAFETKKDEVKKESKAARKKKREEAQKLPEVTKEIYYDVSGDLKAVFGQSQHETAQQEEKANWDQMEEEEGKEKEEEFAPVASVLSAPGAENEDLSGFKFSFFGDDTEAESKETAEYKVEAIQAPKVSWQQDPRFHDSSSEEEEDEQEEEEQCSTTAKTTEAVTPSHTEFFFFCPDDDRLTEGPKLFCRVPALEEQREHWEERRSALRQEYRKKHRDARRKLTSSLKS